MTIFKLPSGTEINSYAQIHKEIRSDVWYIIGNGHEVKFTDEKDADRYIEIYNRNKDTYYIIPVVEG